MNIFTADTEKADTMREVIKAAKDQTKTAEPNGTRGSPEVKYSIAKTTDNRPVVVVNDDILAGIEKSKWVNAVKNEIRKFSPSIPIYGRLIKVNQITTKEYTNSKYTKSLDKIKYTDKMNASGKLDEILLASVNWVNEDLKHTRKDNIKEFARGQVLLRVGSNTYSADVIVANTSGNNMVLYDIVNIQNKSFDIKKSSEFLDGKLQEANSIRKNSLDDNNVSQKNTSVNTYSMQNSEKDVKKISCNGGEKKSKN